MGDGSASQEESVKIQDKGRAIKVTSEEDDVDITMTDPRVTAALGPQRWMNKLCGRELKTEGEKFQNFLLKTFCLKTRLIHLYLFKADSNFISL